MKLATSFYRVFMSPHSVVVVKFSSLRSLINLQSIPPISSLRSRLVRLAAVSLSLSRADAGGRRLCEEQLSCAQRVNVSREIADDILFK